MGLTLYLRDIYNVITSATDIGNCFTLFHRSESQVRELAMPPSISQNPITFGDDEALNVEISEEALHPNEVIRLKVNFQAQEYTTLNEPIMGRMIVHDDNEVPNIREKNFMILPGYYYLLYLMKEMSLLLPKPYQTNCHDYDLRNITDRYNPYLHNPLSQSDCIIGCMARKAMQLCDCWPPELPFIGGWPQEAPENAMKWCDWERPNNIWNKENNRFDEYWKMLKENKTSFQYCLAQHEDLCTRQCPPSCRSVVISVTAGVGYT